MKKILKWMFLFFFVAGNLLADDGYLDMNIRNRFLSPSASFFATYGNTNLKHSTGELDLTIPLYTYSDMDFTIPISLSYTGTGFRPNEQEGTVGLGWALNLGGAVSRQVEGASDDLGDTGFKEDFTSPNPRYFYRVYGIIDGVKNNYYPASLNTLIENPAKGIPEIFNTRGPISVASYSKTGGPSGIADLAPDIFSFYMPGHVGRFNLNWNLEAQVMGNKPYKISFSNSFTQAVETTSKTITIVSPDGYQYIFGGYKETIESSRIFGLPNIDNQYVQIDNAWYLSKIIAPNKREVQFVYRTRNLLPTDANTRSTLLSKGLKGSFNVGSDLSSTPTTYAMGAGLHDETIRYSYINRVYLDEVIIDNSTKIKLNYVDKEYKFYENSDIHSVFNIYNRITLKLSEIIVTHSGSEVKRISFSQNYLGSGSNRRFFLKTLSSGSETYQFDYYNTSSIPKPSPIGVDHWGYYNGKSTIIPSIILTAEALVNNEDNTKIPNEELSKIGMLKEISYPTKGKTNFYYELHQWDYLVRKSGSQQEEVATSHIGIPFPKLTGGLRIKKMEDVNLDATISSTKEYFYSKGVAHYPYYLKNVEKIMGLPMSIECYANAFSRSNSPRDKYIQYGEVEERTTNNGKTRYHFSSYVDASCRDFYNYADTSSYYIISFEYVKPPAGMTQRLQEGRYTDRSYMRGLPKAKEIYDASGNLVCKEENNYGVVAGTENNYTMAINWSHGERVASKYKIENVAYLPTQTIITERRNSQNIVKTTQYTYHANGIMLTEKDVDNNIVIDYKYPFHNSTETPYKQMVSKNILRPVIEKKITRNNAVLQESYIDYAVFVGKTNSDSLFLPSQNWIKNQGESAKRLQGEFKKHDRYGNPAEVVSKDADKFVYLWGYGGKYLIAEIRNATYADVTAKISATTLDAIASASQPTAAQLTSINNLRTQLPLAHVTTYEYKPLVGMSKQTDPRGVITLYDYDAFGRLIKVTHDGNILEEYNYNYKNQ